MVSNSEMEKNLSNERKLNYVMKEGPMQMLTRPIPNKPHLNTTVPGFLLDYGKHEIGLILSGESEYEDPCKLKQGFLALIEKIDVATETMPSIIHLRPVFSVLNTNSLSLFEGEHVTTLYKTMKLTSHLSSYQPQSWKASGFFCFEVLKPKADSKPNFSSSPFGLCAKNEVSMHSWMEAIEKYYSCEMKEVENEEEKNVASGFEIKKLRLNAEEAERRRIKELENSSNKEEEAREQAKAKAKEDYEKLKASLNTLKSTLESNNIKDQKERLRLLEERKRQEDLRDFLHREEDCLTDSLSNKAFESEERAENYYSRMTSSLSQSIINSTQSSLEKEADKTRLVKQMEQDDIVNAERDMNERLKHFLVQETIGFEMDMDSSICYSDELSGAPVKALQMACLKLQTPGTIPDLQSLKNCVVTSQFCTICCSHLIGEAHLDDRMSCKNKCKDRLNGKKSCVTVPLQNQVDTLPHVLPCL